MRRRLLLAACPAAVACLGLAARAETPAGAPTGTSTGTPAERASRQLQQGIREDRAAEAGGPEGPRPAAPTPTTDALEADRRSIAPDVGRPEESGAAVTGGERAATGGGRNPQR